MKSSSSLVWLFPVLGTLLGAQPATAPSSPAPSQVVDTATFLFSAEQLDQLLGPIALYPDALIAIMLPASTAPSQIVLAERYLAAAGDTPQIDEQAWDDSVKALAHYPAVLKWMDTNLAWTSQLGEAFANQPVDVMNAIQRLRTRAREAGTLVDTPQQQIVVDQGTITILPAQPDVIYVPYYDPVVVYAPPRGYYRTSSLFGFSSGFATGWWLSFGLDWGQRRVWAVDRHDRERFWREHHTWRDHSYTSHWRPATPPPIRSWQPSIDRHPRPRPPFTPGPPRVSVVGPHDRDHRVATPPPSNTPPPLWNRDARSHPPGVGPSPGRIDTRPTFSQPLPPPLPNPLPPVTGGAIRPAGRPAEPPWPNRREHGSIYTHGNQPPPTMPSFPPRTPPAIPAPAIPPAPPSPGLPVMGPPHGIHSMPAPSYQLPPPQVGPTAPPPSNPPPNTDDNRGRHNGRRRTEEP